MNQTINSIIDQTEIDKALFLYEVAQYNYAYAVTKLDFYRTIYFGVKR